MSDAVTPRSASEVAAALAGAAAQHRPVRITGGGTKLGWGASTPSGALRLHTEQLARVVIRDGPAPTATLGAGTPLVNVHAQLARSGLMLAIDPQLGLGQRPAATVGGVLATADSGPLSHRYGPASAQVTSVSLALSDGSTRRAERQSAELRSGYDLTRLAIGSFGTLGVLVSVDVRLRPLPSSTATALGSSEDPRQLRDAVLALRRGLHDLQAFDVAWREGHGGLLAQVAGPETEQRATAIANAMLATGLRNTAVRTDDGPLWARQRAGQRSAQRAVLRVHAPRSALDQVLTLATELDATLVGRAALGVSYLTLNVNQIAQVRAGLAPDAAAVALDLPAGARGAIDSWGVPEGPEIELMRQLKRAHDPAGVCNPGVFAGRI